MRLGHLLKAIRKKKGIKQIDLAQKIGVRQPTLSDIENGKISTMETYQKIARGLGYELHEVVIKWEKAKK